MAKNKNEPDESKPKAEPQSEADRNIQLKKNYAKNADEGQNRKLHSDEDHDQEQNLDPDQDSLPPPPPPYLLLEPAPVDPEDAHSPGKDPAAFRPEIVDKFVWDWHPSTLILRALDGFNLTFITAAAILFLVGSGTVFYKHEFVARRTHDRLEFCDFAKYYVCGKIARSKDAHHAYDPAVQAKFLVQQGLGDKKSSEEFIHYPPFDFPLMAPLTESPIDKSFELFTLIGAALFTAATFLLGRAAIIARGRGKLLAYLFFWLAVCASVPIYRAFMLGQTSLILTGFTAIYIWGLVKNRALPAGVALALTAIKPQYSVFLVVPALAQQRFKVLFYAALAEAAMLFAAYKTIGLANLTNYPTIVMHAEQTTSLAGAFVSEMVNARGLLSIFLGDGSALKVAGGLAIAAWILLALLWLKYCPGAGRSDDTTFKLLLAATIMYCLTFSLHTHLYDCLFISIVFLVAGQKSITATFKTKSGTTSELTKLLSVFLLIYPILGWVFLLMPGGVGSYRTAPFAMYNVALCLIITLALITHKPYSKNKSLTEG